LYIRGTGLPRGDWLAKASSQLTELWRRLHEFDQKWIDQRGLDDYDHSVTRGIAREIGALRAKVKQVVKARKAYQAKNCDDILFGDILLRELKAK
jgi:hypothetical protein